MEKNKRHCPLCSGDATWQKELPAPFIESQLAIYYGEAIPPLQIIDYDLYACNQCTLQFFWPLVPGSDRFYRWLSHQPNYYPSNRWEWQVSLSRMHSAQESPVLEVGCGNGDFLKMAGKHGFRQVTGIDTSSTAIDVCEARGLNAFCGTLHQFIEGNPQSSGSFEMIASFHCLEHVPDPLGLILDMKKLLKPEGSLYISTPYSPMSFESVWFDPLNHAPHHLTRWNKQSYQMLANRAGMHLEFFNPGAASPWERTKQAFYFGKTGRYQAISKKRMLGFVLSDIKGFWKEWKNQQQRESVAGKTAPDTILLKLKKQ